MNISPLKPSFIPTIAALTAVLMGGLGKSLHVHQLGSECCGTSHEAGQRMTTCPYGCQHELPEQTGTTSDKSSEPVSVPPHQEHRCAVCSVLALAPEIPEVVILKGLRESAWHSNHFVCASPQPVPPSTAPSRGPPGTFQTGIAG